MIDTIKIYTEISKEVYQKIYNKSIVKSSINKKTGELIYEIINDHLEGSYSSSLSVRVGCGSKYSFVNLGYFIEIEGSYHKIIRGYNSHNGFYDLQYICIELIKLVENSYSVNLPNINTWFLQRCDIAISFDLSNQDNVKSYINSLSRCTYPRRNMKFFYDERYSATVLRDAVDYVKLAEAMGAVGLRATTQEEFKECFAKALTCGKPVLIDCMIDCDDKVWPMVAPGAPISEAFDEQDLKAKEN